MDPRLDGRYLNWLYSTIEREDDPPYSELLKILFQTKFDWFIPNDNNRAADGIDLRKRFIFETSVGIPSKEWLEIDCSFLEMMVALAKKLSFELDEDVANSFWHMMRNIGIDESFSDDTIDAKAVETIVSRVIWRHYDYSGDGGLFPRINPESDQRNIELIYQMYGYVIEREF